MATRTVVKDDLTSVLEIFQFGGLDSVVLRDVHVTAIPYNNNTNTNHTNTNNNNNTFVGVVPVYEAPLLTCSDFTDCVMCLTFQNLDINTTRQTPCGFNYTTEPRYTHNVTRGVCYDKATPPRPSGNAQVSSERIETVLQCGNTCSSRTSCDECMLKQAPEPRGGAPPSTCVWVSGTLALSPTLDTTINLCESTHRIAYFSEFGIALSIVTDGEDEDDFRFDDDYAVDDVDDVDVGDGGGGGGDGGGDGDGDGGGGGACSISCTQRQSCIECESSDRTEVCHWCAGSKQCVSIEKYVPQASLSQCINTHIAPHGVCSDDCALRKNCTECNAREGCGWCDAGTDTGEGYCVTGDGLGPSDNHEKTFSFQCKLGFTWSFYVCPNVNECLSPLFNNACDANATCSDVVQPTQPGSVYVPSYTCTCVDGFTGSGRTCEAVCEKFGCDDVHGECVGPNECACARGWTGDDCSVSCECNEHCVCELPRDFECGDNTIGETCDQCGPGFYGNPVNGSSCMSCAKPCQNLSSTCVLDQGGGGGGGSASEFNVTCTNCIDGTAGKTCGDCAEDTHVRIIDGCVPLLLVNTPTTATLTRAQSTLFVVTNLAGGFDARIQTMASQPYLRYTIYDGFVFPKLDAIIYNVTEVERAIANNMVASIALPCVSRNFLVHAVVINVSYPALAPTNRGSDTIDYQLTLVQDNTRINACASCRDCNTPCITGLFANPQDSSKCIPCRCNNHGDVCNSRSGLLCGFQSQGCKSFVDVDGDDNVVDVGGGGGVGNGSGVGGGNVGNVSGNGNGSGAGNGSGGVGGGYNANAMCACADGTYSSASASACSLNEQPCQCNQCNSSYPLEHDMYTSLPKYRPLNGRRCYNNMSFYVAVQDTVPTMRSHHWFVDYHSLKYTNLPGLFAVYVATGRATIILTTSNEYYQHDSMLGIGNYTVSDVFHTRVNLTKRHSFIVPHDHFNMSSSRRAVFYVHVLCESGDDCQYSMYCEQSYLRLDLVVFFTMFAASFFLMMLTVFAVGKVKSKFDRRRQAQQRSMELRQMALRPLYRFWLVLPENQDYETVSPTTSSKTTTTPTRSRASLDCRSSSPVDNSTSSTTTTPLSTSIINPMFINPITRATPTSEAKYRRIVGPSVMTPLGYQPLKAAPSVAVTTHAVSLPDDRVSLAYALSKFPKALLKKKRSHQKLELAMNSVTETSL